MVQHFLLVITLLGAAVDASNLRNGARRAADGFTMTEDPDIAFPDECPTCAEWETIPSELSLAIGPSGGLNSLPTDPGSLKPGCYESTSAFMLNSTLTLIDDITNGGIFVFRTPGALDTAAGR